MTEKEHTSREHSVVRRAIIEKSLRDALNESALDGFRPLTIGLAAIYGAFTAANLTGHVLPDYAFTAVLGMDLCMLALCAILYWFLRRNLIPAAAAHPIAAGVGGLVAANVLTTMLLLGIPFHTMYLVLICVGAGCCMLSELWLFIVIAMCAVPWYFAARSMGSVPELAYYALALFAGAVLSMVILHSRRSAVIKVYESRQQDAVSREKLARDLHDTEFRYQQIVETSYEGIGITDTRGTIVYVNPRISSMLGRSKGELVGRKFVDIIHPEDRDMAATRLANREEFGNEQYECRYLHKNGDSVWCMVSASPLRDAEGEYIGVLGLLNDLTARKQVEAKAKTQERIAAVGQLAAGIAHDFNNILQAILMYSEMLKRSPVHDDKSLEQVNAIIRQTQRASNLVRQILDFSRKTVRSGQLIDLKQLVSDTVQLLLRTINERIELRFEMVAGTDDVIVLGDTVQLEQMLTNLVVNAQDAMPDGGNVFIRLGCFEIQDSDETPFPNMDPGDWVVLTVADEGPGISPEVQDRVYEPFFTTKEPGKGTGLGLAQAYGIAKQHGGFIDFTTSAEEGTTFVIYLPLAEAQGYETQKAEPKAVDRRGHGELVVVVEDEASLLWITKSTLESYGFEVRALSDPEKAIAECRDLGDEVRVVLSDVVMPRCSGPDLIRQVREACPKAEFILMSGYPLSEHPDEIRTLGSFEWLQKPFALARLIEVVTTAAGR